MDKIQHILCKIAEECNEVGQRALKAQQYGLEEIEPNQELNNMDRLRGEFHDLLVNIIRLEEYVDEDFLILPPEFTEKKLAKIEKYYKFSQGLGRVKNEEKN